MNLAKFFIDNNKFTIVVMLGLTLFGWGGMKNLSSESFPTVNIGHVVITTYYRGASANDIESKITKPIEDEIRTVRGLKEVKSVSQTGVSRIVTIVDIDKYDVEEVVSDLQRSVDRVSDLPTDLENPPHFLEVKSDEFPVIELAVVGSNENRVRDKIAHELKEELEDNKKIASITTTGYRERQFNILVNKKKLENLHVSLFEVTQKIQAQNVNIPGGNLETSDHQSIVKIEGKMKSVEELENLVIRSNFSGERVLLKDVAQIVDGEEDAVTLALYEGKPATLITIAKKGGADIIDLANEVNALTQTFKEKYAGKAEFYIYNDEGLRVKNRVDVLSSNGLAGLILVVFFLLVFLPGKVGVMAAISLPLSILATFGYMSANGMTLNTITILAMVISLGMLVDNAVVIAENFDRLKKEGVKPYDAALETIKELWLPISATALTTIAAFLPMLVTKGVIGQFIRGIPIVVSVALLISLFESFLLLPVRLLIGESAQTPGKKRENEKDWFNDIVVGPFNALVKFLIHHRYLTLGMFTGLIFGSIFMIAVVNKFILFPADQTEIYIARVELPEGARIENTDKKIQELSYAIREKLDKNLLHLAAKVGVSESDFGDPKSRRGENVGIVYLFMSEEAKNTLITNNVLAQLRQIEIPGLKDLSFEAMINGPPAGAPVTAIFRSNNVNRIDEVANTIMNDLKKTEGVFDVRLDDVYGSNEYEITIDQQKAGRLHLDLARIGATVKTAVAGDILGNVNIDNTDVNYFVRLDDKDRTSLEDLKSIKVSDPMGNLIPLIQVASVTEGSQTPQIKRFDFKRAKTVTANINDDIITSIQANAIVAQSFSAIKDKYKDVTLDFGGEGERTQESFESLMQALVLSIIGIFALLVFLFRSYIRPLIILTTIPLGLIGVAISFFLHGRPISFLALIGVIGLGGIIVNSGIVLISFIETLRESQPNRPLSEILVDAAGLRLKAVIVTSLTTVSGLLPTAYGIGGSDEFIIPMTLAMAWGLMSGTILALLWVPCAYAITEDLTNGLKIFIRGKNLKLNIKRIRKNKSSDMLGSRIDV
ncbi:MAG: efflux RND transporter permease subunit [Bdellovibrionales bacterium]|nr:efflux RND transporter permease subunit [Bdellovibrionales bacterium]